MSLVMMFVQFGTQPPKCITKRSLVGVRDPLGALAEKRKRAADRWWLLECATAAAGRDVIAGRERFVCPECGVVSADEDGCCATCGRDTRVKVPGRIVAQGGAR